MLGREMANAIDFKKLTIMELECALAKIKQEQNTKAQLQILTQTGIINAQLTTQLPQAPEKVPLLAQALMQYEMSPECNISDKEIINISSCVYVKDVCFTPYTSEKSVQLKELILFTDHILGLTVTYS